MSLEPKKGHVKCAVYEGGNVIFFRAISEERLDELVDDYCEYVPPSPDDEPTGEETAQSSDYTSVPVDADGDDYRGTSRRFVRVLMSNDPIGEAIRQSDANTQMRKNIIEYAERVLAGRHQQLDDVPTAH